MSRNISLAHGDYERLVNYEYYKNVYGGELIKSGNIFNRLNRKAELAVSFYTLNKVSKFKEGTKEYIDLLDTICEIIDLYYQIEYIGFKTSQKSGEMSVSYSIDSRENKREVLHIIKKNLTYTGALYRGV